MMPVVFIGHGSPMNAIETNEFTIGWQKLAEMIPKPTAILSISAHWQTRGTKVSVLEQPQPIHDFYGFPQELFDVKYPAQGSPYWAQETIQLLGDTSTGDKSWGIDHGTWSVLKVMYPQADIPVYQMSLDQQASPRDRYQMGEKLAPLREDGVLILGSGNIVHNLGIADFSVEGGYEWAYAFDDFITEQINHRNHGSILGYRSQGEIARLSVPTTEHYDPLLYALGAASDADKLTIYNKACIAGSISMTSYVFA